MFVLFCFFVFVLTVTSVEAETFNDKKSPFEGKWEGQIDGGKVALAFIGNLMLFKDTDEPAYLLINYFTFDKNTILGIDAGKNYFGDMGTIRYQLSQNKLTVTLVDEDGITLNLTKVESNNKSPLIGTWINKSNKKYGDKLVISKLVCSNDVLILVVYRADDEDESESRYWAGFDYAISEKQILVGKVEERRIWQYSLNEKTLILSIVHDDLNNAILTKEN
jgi:hypothetical protein